MVSTASVLRVPTAARIREAGEGLRSRLHSHSPSFLFHYLFFGLSCQTASPALEQSGGRRARGSQATVTLRSFPAARVVCFRRLFRGKSLSLHCTHLHLFRRCRKRFFFLPPI